jgi:hypothetical protein
MDDELTECNTCFVLISITRTGFGTCWPRLVSIDCQRSTTMASGKKSSRSKPREAERSADF